MKHLILAALLFALAAPAHGQEARRRWEMQRQIRLDKFEQVLPRAMRDNGIDMWIVAVKENHYDPLWKDLGRGYVSGHRLLRLHRSRRRPHRARRARTERLPLERVRRLRHLRAGIDARRLRQGAQSAPHRREHVRRDRPGRRPVGDHARAPEEDARRAVCVATRVSAEQLVATSARTASPRKSSPLAKPRASRSSSPSARCRTR